MRFSKMTGVIALLCAVVASACAGTSSSLLPTSPSAVVADSSNSVIASAQSGATGSAIVDQGSDEAVSSGLGKPSGAGNGNGNGGNGNGNGGNPNANGGGGNGNGNPNGNGGNGPPAQTPGPPADKKVELEGLIESIAGLILTVNGQAVTVPATVIVHHGSTVVPYTDLAVGDRVHIKAVLVVGVLTATDVKLQNPGDGSSGPSLPPVPATVDGVVVTGSLTGSCSPTPTLGFTVVDASLVLTTVVTNSSTVFTGGTCGNVAVGGHVTVVGLLQSGVLTATQVTIF